MLDQYRAHLERKNRSINTIKLRMLYLRKFAERYDIATAQHDDMLEHIYSNPAWSDNSRKAIVTTLRTFYRWAHDEGLLAENPARDVPNIIVPPPPRVTASDEAIAAAVRLANPSDKAMILLGAECGLRVHEIAKLHTRDRQGNWVHIIGKGRRQRSLRLSPELAAVLDKIEPAHGGYYFPGMTEGLPICTATARRHIERLLGANPHSLRRRAATTVYSGSGHDIRLTQVFLGHAQSTTTEVYLGVRDDDLMRAGDLTRIAA